MRPSRKLLQSPTLPSLKTVGFATQRFGNYVNRRADLHTHDVVELFFVLAGSGRHLTDSGAQPLEPGDLGVVNFGQHHSIVTGREPMDVVNIYLDPARYRLPPLSPPLSGVLPRLLPLSPGLGHQGNRVQQFHLPDGAVMAGLLLALNREASDCAPGHLDAMQNYLRLFLIECARAAAAVKPDLVTGGASLSPGVARVCRVLNTHWNRSHRLGDLATVGRTSREHLCRLFRRETGKTVIEYLHQRRIEQAMMLLDSTDEKIIAVAFEVGFRDLSQFNRVFRRIAGVTPSAFRRRGGDERGPVAARRRT